MSTGLEISVRLSGEGWIRIRHTKALRHRGAFFHAAFFNLEYRARAALRARAVRCRGVILAAVARPPIA
jgi:hypothetical protein